MKLFYDSYNVYYKCDIDHNHMSKLKNEFTDNK